MEHPLYTVEEAAARLKLHPKTVRRKIREGALQATRLGHQYRISESALAAFGGTSQPEDAIGRQHQILASTILDADAIAPEEAQRVTNTLMAGLQNQRTNLRVDCHYFEETGRLRIVINGGLEHLPNFLEMAQGLLQHAHTTMRPTKG